MEKVRVEVQTLLNQTLQAERVTILNVECKRFIDGSKTFTDYVIQSTFTPTTAKTHFLS